MRAAVVAAVRGKEDLMSPSKIPAPAEGPDPSEHDDWEPEAGDSIAGIVRDREEVETKFGVRTVLSVDTGGGDVTRVPCFRTHLRELVGAERSQVDDGIWIGYYGTEEGRRKERYAMRVSKQDSLLDDEPSEAAEESKVSRQAEELLGDEGAS